MCDFNDRYIEDGHRPLLSHLIILKSPLAARYIEQYPANQLNRQDSDGNTPLMHAITTKDSNHIAKQLIEKLSPNQLNVQNNEGDTALMMGVWFSLVEIVKQLISRLRGIDLNTKNKAGETALTLAIKNKNVDITALLQGRKDPKVSLLSGKNIEMKTQASDPKNRRPGH